MITQLHLRGAAPPASWPSPRCRPAPPRPAPRSQPRVRPDRQARQQRLCGDLLAQAQQEAAAGQPAVQEGVLAGGAAVSTQAGCWGGVGWAALPGPLCARHGVCMRGGACGAGVAAALCRGPWNRQRAAGQQQLDSAGELLQDAAGGSVARPTCRQAAHGRHMTAQQRHQQNQHRKERANEVPVGRCRRCRLAVPPVASIPRLLAHHCCRRRVLAWFRRRWVKLRISTKAMKTIEKRGLQVRGPRGREICGPPGRAGMARSARQAAR